MKTVTIGKHKVVFEAKDNNETVSLNGQYLGLLPKGCDWIIKSQIARLVIRAHSMNNKNNQSI